MWGFAGVLDVRLSLNALVGTRLLASNSVIIIYALVSPSGSSEVYRFYSEHLGVSGRGFALVLYLGMGFAYLICFTCFFIRVGTLLSNRLLLWTTFDNLTSNQVGLPAELKHINKRRKRN